MPNIPEKNAGRTTKPAGPDGVVAMYHVVRKNEDFDHAANAIFQILSSAQQNSPNVSRHLYLDIEGHRNENGGFDRDMLELQQEFVMGFLGPWIQEYSMPLIQARRTEPQLNDVPAAFEVQRPHT